MDRELRIICMVQKPRHHKSSFVYFLVEKNPLLKEQIKSSRFPDIPIYSSVEDLPPIKGLIFSNELIDNFPVHRVEMQEDLMEIFVDYDKGFIEVLLPAKKEVKKYFEELKIELPHGMRTEVNLDALVWLQSISEKLIKGFVMTIDYGGTSNEIYSSRFMNGTLVNFFKHKVFDHPYVHIGEQDITSHVNFSAISHWGKKFGLQELGLVTQSEFLLSHGYKDYLENKNRSIENLSAVAIREAFLAHKLLIEMGEKFKVLLQEKGVLASPLRAFKRN